MKLLVFLLLLIWAGIRNPAYESDKDLKISTEEVQLLKQINAYRKQIGLASIPWSEKLATVARLHAEDLQKFPPKAPCNMHSWSENGNWTPCCYTPDHSEAACMWNKPKELTDYPGNGYEISAMNTAVQVDWLGQWQKSKGHHQVLINEGIWKGKSWKAMGLAIPKPYAVVWFGLEIDSDR